MRHPPVQYQPMQHQRQKPSWQQALYCLVHDPLGSSLACSEMRLNPALVMQSSTL
jgi:hypothetical protein